MLNRPAVKQPGILWSTEFRFSDRTSARRKAGEAATLKGVNIPRDDQGAGGSQPPDKSCGTSGVLPQRRRSKMAFEKLAPVGYTDLEEFGGRDHLTHGLVK